MEALRVIGFAGLYVVVNLIVAAVWTTALARAPGGVLVGVLAAPIPPAMVAYAWLGQPYHCLFSGAWAFCLGVVVVTVVPLHQTKSGRRDRRYKNNPDVSGISGGERLVALLGFLSVVAVMVLAWYQRWPGSRLK